MKDAVLLVTKHSKLTTADLNDAAVVIEDLGDGNLRVLKNRHGSDRLEDRRVSRRQDGLRTVTDNPQA